MVSYNVIVADGISKVIAELTSAGQYFTDGY